MKNQNQNTELESAAQAILQSGRIFNRPASAAELSAARHLVDSRPYWARLAAAQDMV